MTRACFSICIASLVAMVLCATSASAQPTPGTFTYFWTTTAGAPITNISATTSATFTVQLRIQETGGNAFVTGIGAYDSRVTWGQSGTGQDLFSFATSAATGENTNIRTNPYASNGFTGPGAILNTNTATINTNRTLNVTRSVLTISDPAQWVKQTTSPNTGTSILLMELTFTTGNNTGTTTITGAQRPDPQINYLYDLDEGNPGNTDAYLYLDNLIAGNNAVLTVDIAPIPEPGTILGVCVAALGFVGLVRRYRRPTTVLAA